MTTRSLSSSTPQSRMELAKDSRVYSEGIIAGLIGAATVALWFFLLDAINGRPFYTPSVLGEALIRASGGTVSAPDMAVSFETVLMYTWVHSLAFCLIGGIASKLIDLAETDGNLGFGILLLFVVFEFGFIAAAFIFAEPVLHALTWPAVLIGNLLAAGVMAGYFWRRHPSLAIEP